MPDADWCVCFSKLWANEASVEPETIEVIKKIKKHDKDIDHSVTMHEEEWKIWEKKNIQLYTIYDYYTILMSWIIEWTVKLIDSLLLILNTFMNIDINIHGKVNNQYLLE